MARASAGVGIAEPRASYAGIHLHESIEHLRVLERTVRQWLEEREYESVEQLQGSMSQLHSPDPNAFERAQYVRGLQSYRPG